jgi:hypothetical protein
VKKFTPERIKVFYAAISGWPELRGNAFFLLDPIDIDSDLARDLRASMPSERKRAEENHSEVRDLVRRSVPLKRRLNANQSNLGLK